MARILVMTIAHPPADARIFHREIAALRDYGHEVTYAAPFVAFGQEPPVGSVRSTCRGRRVVR